MLKVKKGPRILRVDDSAIDNYKKLGYTVMTMDGKVIYTPTTDKDLVAQLTKENTDLKAEIARLTHAVNVLEDRLKEYGVTNPAEVEGSTTDAAPAKKARAKKPPDDKA